TMTVRLRREGRDGKIKDAEEENEVRLKQNLTCIMQSLRRSKVNKFNAHSFTLPFNSTIIHLPSSSPSSSSLTLSPSLFRSFFFLLSPFHDLFRHFWSVSH